VSSALIQATSRHRSASRARAYAAARCVLPTPRSPVTARTTDTRPGPASAASKSARGWNPTGSRGISPTTTRPRPAAATGSGFAAGETSAETGGWLLRRTQPAIITTATSAARTSE
jgi:hypothetical protein